MRNPKYHFEQAPGRFYVPSQKKPPTHAPSRNNNYFDGIQRFVRSRSVQCVEANGPREMSAAGTTRSRTRSVASRTTAGRSARRSAPAGVASIAQRPTGPRQKGRGQTGKLAPEHGSDHHGSVHGLSKERSIVVFNPIEG